MKESSAQDPYKARITINNKIIYKVTGKSIEELQPLLHARCQTEESGVKGEIIEISSGEIVYSCNKQTIIDQ